MEIGHRIKTFFGGSNTGAASGTSSAGTTAAPSDASALGSDVSLDLPPDTAELGGRSFSSPAGGTAPDKASTAGTSTTSPDGDKFTLKAKAGQGDKKASDPILGMDTLGDDQLGQQLKEASGAPAA